MKKEKGRKILKKWKNDSYIFGIEVLEKVGGLASGFGQQALLIGSDSPWAKKYMEKISKALEKNGISFTKVIGARPNAPREDVYRIALQIRNYQPDGVIAFGGGSKIDAAKAASVLATFKPDEVANVLAKEWSIAGTIEPLFGSNNVKKLAEKTGKNIYPVLAVQSASGSAAHLTKYSNVTDPVSGQKKLISDETIVPPKALFDYSTTFSSPPDLTLDGGLDGISHLWEVFMGAKGNKDYEKIKKLNSIGLDLIIKNLEPARENDEEARVALGIGTDLGGHSIMLGSTNGPHLGSFSLVDILTHGRACAVLSPYYTVFFSPEIQDQLNVIAPILEEAGYIQENVEKLQGTDLGKKVAKGMLKLNDSLGLPTSLKESGANKRHLDKMIEAAKDPQLEMKLLNMPVPLDPSKGDIDKYMAKLVKAAFKGDLGLIEMKK